MKVIVCVRQCCCGSDTIRSTFWPLCVIAANGEMWRGVEISTVADDENQDGNGAFRRVGINHSFLMLLLLDNAAIPPKKKNQPLPAMEIRFLSIEMHSS